MTRPQAPRPIFSWKKFWVSSRHSTWARMGQLCVTESPSEPVHPGLQPSSSRRGRHREREPGTGEGTWAQNLHCAAQTHRGHSTPKRPDKSLSPSPVTEQSCHSPCPHCVCCGCSLFVFGCPLGTGRALRAQTHRVSYISTPVIIHPVISDWSVVFIICYSSVSCLKCFQSRHRKSCPVPNQTHAHAAELPGTKPFPNILVSTQHVETTQPSSAALVFPQRRL